MGFQIEDGTGDCYQAKVNNENQLETVSVSKELQHHISLNEGQVYQCIGTVASVSPGVNTLIHIKNTSATKKVIVS